MRKLFFNDTPIARVKYYYDSESLSFRPIKTNKISRISNLFLFLFASFLFGLISLFVLLNTDWMSTPAEITQERELKNYELQYELLNRKLTVIETVLENIEERDNELYRVYFEASPIPKEQRQAGFGGVNRYKHLEGFDNSDLIINATKRLDILTRQTAVQSKSLEEIERLAENEEELLQAIPSIQPINNAELIRVASGFGQRTDPFTKKRRMHKGMDFSAKKGTPIYATGNGTVIRADSRSAGYGKHIRIDHGFGYVTVYAHLSKFNTKKGNQVKRGDIIGFVGNTGRSVAPHLHYEVVKNNDKINPLNFYYGNLSPEEYDNIINQASQESQSLD